MGRTQRQRKSDLRFEDKVQLKAQRREAAAAATEARNAYRANLGELFADARWRDLFGDDKLLLIDGGAFGGVEQAWRAAAPLTRVVAVEPRPKRFGETADGDILLDVALDRTCGERDLYVAGSMSSFIEPDLDAWVRFGFDRRPRQDRLRVRTTTLDAIVEEHGLRFVDFIKLDTQGTELDILQGGPKAVGELAIGMRIETLFVPLYKGQPLFADVDAYVRAQGFDLVDLDHFRRYVDTRTGDADPDTMKLSRGRLVVADGLYFRSPEWLAKRLGSLHAHDRNRTMAAAMVACVAYVRPDLAALYIEAAKDLLLPATRGIMLDLLIAPLPERQP
jgi:FkbM family methyltransferase